MIRPQIRQISLQCERARFGLSTPVRQFSCSRTVAAEDQNQPSGPKPNTRPPPSDARSRQPRKPNGPPARPNQNQSRPARVIDARSFAASKATGGEQPKIIRSPRMRTARGGNQGQNRKAKPSAKGKGPRKSRRSNTDSFVNAEAEEAEAAAIEAVEQEQILKDRPVPIRYEPQDITYSTLRETWPSIPTDANSRSAAVYEKLVSLSGRYANGYVAPHELGRRLWKGQSVLFSNEAEKTEALGETKRLAQLRADRISQHKGDLVEPRTVEFNPINAESTRTLMETLAQGKYPTAEAKKDGHAVLGEVTRNLMNNGTYQTPGKTSQFMAKLESLVSGSIKRV
ncbi:hypothetical protein PENANT_c050G06687 [Penicillium antarcticum]|uniref:Uncharacterized protein n=1 Tax=Penicillium antarcticum TaxID=416450 RepID=A0A1V6PRB8_9EURO|nr:uncharacterized protein N7508_006893 [Penicillium antarcticum]KAJ5302030.1 hypothetical protein N7508_006893 [Penicillium antarcticum]OQD79483.1 hypothetical protein PENANT_c050G06687 [Penicillium antarcticum]